MASRKKSTMKHNDNENTKKKSPSFVRLDGLSQSAKDRQMNDRTVKPPKNLNLIEGNPEDTMELRRTRQTDSFPSEQSLSSKIKESNGMDYSNYSIEEYYRNRHSKSPENQEDSTHSLSLTSGSSHSGCREETCTPNISGSTEVESFSTESDLPADSSPLNHREDNFQDCNTESIDTDKIDQAIRSCRYSKNAAIIGLIKQNMISLNDLELNAKESKSSYSANNVDDIENSPNDKNVDTIENVENGKGKFDSNTNKIAEYPHLVPHPEDPEVYTHPYQAYGKVDDSHIDFRLQRMAVKTSTTSRQYYIREGLNDDKFTFKQNTKAVPKSALANNLPKINSPTYSSNYCNSNPNNSYNSVDNDENDGFKLNRDGFPPLPR